MRHAKKRYILIYHKIERVDHVALESAIKARVSDLFGVVGLQSINLKLIRMEPNFFIIKCDHKHTDDVLFALGSMNFEGFTLLPIRVSGTIKKLRSVMAEFVQVNKP
ncbi:MAG: Rpp14/Pop5 family protein [Nitrososphaerales archaeon]